MTAWDARKAKALLWFWLNFHPAETYHTSPLEILEDGYSDDPSFYSEQDMLVQAENGFSIGSISAERFFVNVNTDHWHDVNRAVTDWFGGLRPERKESTFRWLEEVKGKPLDRWQPKYTQAESPHWDSLVKAFKFRRILNGE
jgi:hypothetical protein